MNNDSAKSPRTTRRQRQQEETRREILEAALGSFATRGFRETRMADIAEAAGFTAASLYTYFKSKAEIVLGCEALLADEMQAALGEAPAFEFTDKAAFTAEFRARVASMASWCGRRREGIALFWRLRWTGDPEAVGPDEAELMARAGALLGHVSQVLRALGLERFSWLKAEEAAGVLLGAIEGAIVRAVVGCDGGSGQGTDIDDARISRIVLFGILGGENN